MPANSEPLHVRIGRLRDEARAVAVAPVSGRPQMNEIDGTIALAAHLSAQGTRGAERRQAIGSVKIGTTVTEKGAAKTLLSRAEKLDKTLAWAKGLTEDQRNEFMASDRFEVLTDRQQEVVAEAFGQIEDRAYEDSIGIENVDLAAPLIDIDQLPEDETESVGDSFEVQEGEDVQSFDIDDSDPWQGDVV